MPSQSLSDIKQRDWMNACYKLGLSVQTNHGKGSHILVKHPKSGMKYTIQHDLHKIINMKILNKLKQWGFSDEQIFDALR